jgi:hypothetical protein
MIDENKNFDKAHRNETETSGRFKGEPIEYKTYLYDRSGEIHIGPEIIKGGAGMVREWDLDVNTGKSGPALPNSVSDQHIHPLDCESSVFRCGPSTIDLHGSPSTEYYDVITEKSSNSIFFVNANPDNEKIKVPYNDTFRKAE